MVSAPWFPPHPGPAGCRHLNVPADNLPPKGSSLLLTEGAHNKLFILTRLGNNSSLNKTDQTPQPLPHQNPTQARQPAFPSVSETLVLTSAPLLCRRGLPHHLTLLKWQLRRLPGHRGEAPVQRRARPSREAVGSTGSLGDRRRATRSDVWVSFLTLLSK